MLCGSYSHRYRRLLLDLLTALEFRCTTEIGHDQLPENGAADLRFLELLMATQGPGNEADLLNVLRVHTEAA